MPTLSPGRSARGLIRELGEVEDIDFSLAQIYFAGCGKMYCKLRMPLSG